MQSQSIIQQALGEQWQQLPPALQAHYMPHTNKDIGTLDIEYPQFMQRYLNLIFRFGALFNRCGKNIPTVVQKRMDGKTQHWKRTIRFQADKEIIFQSRWEYAGSNELIEYVNRFMGLRMAVNVKQGKLYYRGISLILKIGPFRIPIPEWLLLGHTTIVETAIDENHFAMDFKLHHPFFGMIYRYSGIFRTEIIN
ncbi:MAG: DUF4166 domain-containing protein [Nitrosomonas sp.]|nr:DUF4166 domain-containing protein [Nitrosomonas sp.]